MRMLIGLAFAALILGSASRATAEINMADSIEWMTADSNVVVVGKVSAVTQRPGDGSVVWYVATVAVGETLKGAPRKTVDIAIRHLTGDSPQTWKVKGSELLLFLVDSKRRKTSDGPEANSDYDKAPLAIRRGRWEDDAIVIGTGRAYTSAFQVLSKRDELIAAVRGAAKSTAIRSVQLDTPLDSPAGRSLYGGSAVFLYAPVDAATEQLAIGWLADKDIGTRERAVIVLGQIKSDANIERLKKLLADPGSNGYSEGNGPTVKRHVVRKRAHEALTAWGVAHPTPVIDEPMKP